MKIMQPTIAEFCKIYLTQWALRLYYLDTVFRRKNLMTSVNAALLVQYYMHKQYYISITIWKFLINIVAHLQIMNVCLHPASSVHVRSLI